MRARSARWIWEMALGELQTEVNRLDYLTYLCGTVGLSFHNGEFIVGVLNTLVAEFLERDQRFLIEKVLTGLLQGKVKVHFRVGTTEEQADFETRRTILQAKADENEVDITPDVLDFIALQATENMPGLEGSLNRVVAYSKLISAQATLELAARALQNIASKEPPPAPPTLTQIAEAVAASYRVTPSDLKGRKRDEATVLARQVSIYLMRKETDRSLADIGRELGGHSPATISDAYEKIASSIDNDPHLKGQVFNIQRRIRAPTMRPSE